MILVLTVFVLLLVIALFRLNSKQAIVNKRLLLVSGGQRSLSADVSIKKLTTSETTSCTLSSYELMRCCRFGINILLPYQL